MRKRVFFSVKVAKQTKVLRKAYPFLLPYLFLFFARELFFRVIL